MRPKGIILDEHVAQDSKNRESSPIESPIQSTPTPPRDDDTEPKGEGRGTGVASRQYFYNSRAGQPYNQAVFASGATGHAAHRDKQMVLVFAHSGRCQGYVTLDD